MSFLAERFRQESDELLEAASHLSLGSSLREQLMVIVSLDDANEIKQELAKLIEAWPTSGDWRNLASTIIARVNAQTLSAMADMTELLGGRMTLDETSSRRRAATEFNHQLREAAAKASATGDWSEYNAIVDHHYRQIHAGNDGESSPTDGSGDREVPAPA